MFAKKKAPDTDLFSETFHGEKFIFEDPDQDRMHIQDIARSLSQTNRFNGHTKFPYSVAQHSVLMADYFLLKNPHSIHVAYLALMHDAHEAYLGDVSSPLKRLLPAYNDLEETWRAAVAERFKLYHSGWSKSHRDGLDSLVREADLRILEKERRSLMPHTGSWKWVTDKLDPLPVQIREWGYDHARLSFLDRYYALKPTDLTR